MISRGPFQPLPFCDSVKTSQVCFVVGGGFYANMGQKMRRSR